MKRIIVLGGFDPADSREIKRRVLGSGATLRNGAGLPSHTDRFRVGWHYVILKEDLPVATNPLTGFSQASANICMYVSGTDSLNMQEITNLSDRITITNRSTSSSARSGDFILVKWNLKEWMPVWMSSTSVFRHGIVSENLGCGYYTVQMAVWVGSLDNVSAYTGSAVSSGDDTNCDVCYDVSGRGTDSCGITLHYPPLQVAGTGEVVTAYHRASSMVPLKIGTACYMAGNGSEDNTPSSSSSGSSSPPTIWQIVDGLQEHVVQYIEEWDCCDGAGESGIETLLYRTPIVFAARVCETIQCGTCSVPSSSSGV